MKKLSALLLVVVMLFSLVACNNGDSGSAGGTGTGSSGSGTTSGGTTSGGTTSGGTTSGDTGESGSSDVTAGELDGMLVGVTVVTLGNPFLKGKADGLVQMLEEAGAEVSLVSAESDVQTQLQHVENFIAMGCDAIGIHAVNAEALEAITAEAMAKGIKCVFYGALPAFDFTSYSGSDNEASGKICAEMGLAYIDDYYPDASAENPVEAILLSNYKTQNHAQFSYGCIERLEQDPRVKIVHDEPDLVDDTISEQNLAEELLSSYPNAKLFFCASESGAIGPSNAIMALKGSGEGYGTFAATASDTSKEMVEMSKTNASAVRGVLEFPGSASAWFNATRGALTGEFSDSYLDWLVVEPITSTSYVYEG